MKRTEFTEKILPTLPKSPGVYQFRDKKGTIIYVGKAKNLINRLKSYFQSAKNMAHKTRVMVKQATDITFIIVDSEHDALLLESTMIKKEQPRYNVMLKDAKSYTYICIKNERFPRVFFTRKVIKDGSEYFGPYTSKYNAKIVLDFVKHLFQLRTCNYNLSEDNINGGKFKVCLEYHIENCLGPCEGLETEENYNEKIKQIRNILKGNFADVKRHIKIEMNKASENLNFEEAQKWKIRFEAFQDYQSKSTVVSTTIKDVDVFSIVSTDEVAFVNYMKVINGMLINTYTVELEKNLDENNAEVLQYAALDFREKANSIAPEMITSIPIEWHDESIKLTVPQRGDKRHLLQLSEKNATYFKLQKQKEEATRANKQTSTERILKTIQSDLNMDQIPYHIECFDNSNIQGSHPVAACVVFKNAKPSKKDYRKFHIKTVVGPDDFASMEEIVYRRYYRLVKENEPLPQLVIIDGGKGQLSSSMKSIKKLGLENKIVVIGIAKKLEEIFFPGDAIPLHIDKRSESLKVIQHLRNEAHRFAITFHRNERSKAFTQTALTDVPGVGDKTARKIIVEFGSLNKMLNAPVDKLVSLVGPSVADKIKNHFQFEEE